MQSCGVDLVYNDKTKKWEAKKEPYCTIEIETEDDYNFLQEAIEFYTKYKEEHNV